MPFDMAAFWALLAAPLVFIVCDLLSQPRDLTRFWAFHALPG